MTSALTRRAWRELSRRPGRAALTVLTMAVAVAGVWIFVTPNQLGAAMDERVEQDRIHDVILWPDGVALDSDELDRLRSLPNVAGLEARAVYWTDLQTGTRVQTVRLVGVDDFDDQEADRVHVDSGRPPGAGEAVTDPQNSRSGRFGGGIGSNVVVRGVDGTSTPLTIAGVGSTIYHANSVIDGDPVLYVSSETVFDLVGSATFNQIAFRVVDRSDEATTATIDAVRAELAAIRPGVSERGLPELRPAGEWPGEDGFDNFLVLFWVIGAVSLLSAVLLIATTMNTMVREQHRVIGIMKALGARRWRVIANFGLTAVLLGTAATVLGIIIGFPLSGALIDFLGSEMIGTELEWQFSLLPVLLSVVVGLGGAVLASIPALLRVSRTPVHEALGTPGIEAGYGQGAIDRALGQARALPRTWQLGLRSAARRKGRSAATIAQVALAVGTMLAFSSAVITMIWVSEQSRDAEGGDLQVWTSGSGPPLDAAAFGLVAGIAGIEAVQPIVGIDALVGDTDTFAWGLPADPVFAYELGEGRWFTEAEDEDRASVAVVGPALADIHGLEVGDTVSVETGAGAVAVEVVGVDTTMVGDGKALFIPIETVLAARGMSHPTEMWVTTVSEEHDDVDRVAATVRTELTRGGYAFELAARYVENDADRATDRTIIAVIMSLGIPVVAIGMIGLVNTMATNILERSREIGVMRSIGARARDVRRVFRSEAVALVVVGWALGIGVGWLLGRLILGAVNDAFHVTFPQKYPLWPMGVALVVALVVAGAALWRPLRRASGLPPSEALRYQ